MQQQVPLPPTAGNRGYAQAAEPPAAIAVMYRAAKRCMDIAVSAALLLVLSPLMLCVALVLYGTSLGPVWFVQERIGYRGKPFRIIKFRTMVVDAEPAGPQLSSAHDPRVTPIGRILRKWRIDELPQLWNVLLGDMSLVGPRPERAFYLQAIINRLPQYQQVTTVPPGITSLGMVQCGYAENISELVARAHIELQYIHAPSFLQDCRILVQTIRIICMGKGK